VSAGPVCWSCLLVLFAGFNKGQKKAHLLGELVLLRCK
jgi:hypothetical protein